MTAGLGAGLAWSVARPSPYNATASVVLTQPPRYPTAAKGPMNVDTDGQLVAGDRVKEATAKAPGLRGR